MFTARRMAAAPRTAGARARMVAAPFLSALAVAMVSGCGTGTSATGHASLSGTTAAQSPLPSPTPSPSPQPPPGPLALAPPDAGRLPQTSASPRAQGAPFSALSTDLWLAVKADKPSLAQPAFFPVRAYEQVKAIWNAGSDWRYRLWVDFTVDVKAAHDLLGADATQAKLIRIIVPSTEAAWVGPGACFNKVGYWHVAGERVVYRLHGQERSFGIASMISWRGVWYVIHFGGITRPAVGMVDAPAIGPGQPGPPGGC